jgi:outer membrane protein
MKKILIIVNAVLAVAVIGLYILYFCSADNKPSALAMGETVAVEGSVVYIQIDSLVQSYDMFHELKAGLEKKADNIRKDLDNKGNAFKFKVKDFEEKVQKGLITRAQAEQQQ